MTSKRLLTQINELFDLGVEIGIERQKLEDIVDISRMSAPEIISQSATLDDLVARHLKLSENLNHEIGQLFKRTRKHHPRSGVINLAD